MHDLGSRRNGVGDLARTIATDLAAVGLPVRHGTDGSTPGVAITLALDSPGVLVGWAQHEASPTVLGLPVHGAVQRRMNVALAEVLEELGYPIAGYGPGGAHLVAERRLPLGPQDHAVAG